MANERNYCCEACKWGMQSRGKRGLAIVRRTNDDVGVFFEIEFRAVDEGSEGMVPKGSPVPVALQFQQVIKYCPWCGTKLADFYE
jgi:hypothetical protein